MYLRFCIHLQILYLSPYSDRLCSSATGLFPIVLFLSHFWFFETPWKILWRRKWQSTPVFLPGKLHRWRSLTGYSPWGHKEPDTTEQLHFLSTDCSTPGFPVLHYLLQFAQTQVHQVDDAIQPSHSLSPPLLLPSFFPGTRVFSNEYQVAKILELHLQYRSFHWISRGDYL